MKRLKTLTAFLLLLSIYTTSFAPFAQAQRRIGRTPSSGNQTMNQENKNGLQFRLSEGIAGAEQREKQMPAQTNPLSEAEAGSLLKRLPTIKQDKDDQTDFAKRAGSLPPPKTGEKIPVKFPADEQRNAPGRNTGASNVLEVVRYSPEGAVNLAPDLSVTFSQPMVAVTSQEQAAQTVPVQVSPNLPEGNWRWLGTKTLMFDTKNRFPMATKFTARIPAGTKSATGQTLAKDVVWNFQTPPPIVETKIPESQVVKRDQIIFISFDQQINPQAVLQKITVSANGRKIPVRLATEAEVAADEKVSYYAKNAQPNRWLAFRSVNSDGTTANALPADSPISVIVEKGTPSAEGPLVTDKAQAFSFNTFGAMKFLRARCGWDNNKKVCDPLDTWQLEFTNQIDVQSFDKSLVTIEPNISDLKIYPSANYIYIEGMKPPRKTFTVTVSSALKDQFGQVLESQAKVTFTTGKMQNTFRAGGGNMVVLDPYAKPVYSIYSTNYTSASVKIYKVQPTDWNQFAEYCKRVNYDDGRRPPMPGSLIATKNITISGAADDLTETVVDLSEYLPNGLGNVILDIEPAPKTNNRNERRVVWIQGTKIGLDAFVDNQELVGFATDLRDGKPLSGVQMTIHPNGQVTRGNGQTVSENQEQGWIDWALSYFNSEEKAHGPSAVDENGAETAIETVEEAQTNTTGANGILRLGLPESAPKQRNILIARKGNDVAFLPENSEYYWQETGNWYRKADADSLRWFTFDDRKMYRPKEEVSVKGYIRKVTGGKFGDVEGLGDAASGLTYTVFDSRNNEIGKGTANLNAFGAFDFKFKLPDNANLGYSRVELKTNTKLGGETYQHSFQIQEFRRPEFEVNAQVETPAPHMVKQDALVSATASYYAGGGLANAETNWVVTSTPTNYTPPNRDDFTFGKWFPWWRSYGGDYSQTTSQNFKGVTDASGKHVLKIDFESANPPRPYNLSARVSVQDVNRQTFAGQTNLLVHPSSLYVGIRTKKTFVRQNESFEVETIVTDIDGKIVANRNVEMKAVLKDWIFDKGEWKQTVVEEQNCNVQSAENPVKCGFKPTKGGVYTITARVLDDRERPNESEITVWVAGGKTEPKRNVEKEEAQLIPDKKDYKAGDVAEILVQSPFADAEGVLTLRRDGLVKTERFTMKGTSIVLKIPLEEKYLPNIYAQVDLVGASERLLDDGKSDAKLPKRPAFASGAINLSISKETRELTVTAEPREKTLAPAGTTKIDVAVKDSRGEPVGNTEVAVVVVDDSVLALTNYQLANPLDVFYTQRGDGVSDYHSRAEILLSELKNLNDPNGLIAQFFTGRRNARSAEDPAGFNQMQRAPAAPMARMKAETAVVDSSDEVIRVESEESQNEQINLRQNFSALAVFAPSVKTDGSGKATVDVKLPDNLTRYRVMAVAVDTAKRFGKGESSITAKNPLMVRPSAPRFMNFGDKIELPVVIQNQTDKDMTVDVAVRATNAELTAGNGRRVVVKANDRAEVRFPVSAVKAGTARFQIATTSGSFADAAEIELPVWTPATTEAFATYGTTDKNGAIIQPVEAPRDVFPQFGGLEITTSSTQLQELTDAFIYLQTYPFECSEQVASRMISIAALQDVLKAFKAKDMPTQAQLEKRFARDMEILKSRQQENGYFGLWKRDGERYKYPFVTAHVAHALVLAKQKGYKVPEEMLTKVKPYLKNIESHFDEWHKSPEVRRTISAYALYVRNLMGDKDAVKAKKLLAEAGIEKMPFEALGWILSVLADDANSQTEVANIKRFLMNRTAETAATANFVTDYGDAEWLIMYSNRRADGVLLEALLKADPNNDLIPKLVRGLLDHRTKGRWSNTQENVFILLALDKYFQTYEKVTPDFVTKVWLGNTYAGEQAFRGRSVDSNLLNIPMSYLMEQNGAANLIFDKQGAGRLYYRIGMKYAPKNLDLAPADYGFTVLRKYEAVDNAEDVKQNADGSWVIKSGARVRVRLTMVAPSRRYHVALVDNLPAGLEILNPELATTEAIPTDDKPQTVDVYSSRSYGYGWWWRRYWFDHQNFRDERAEAFAGLLWEGVYNYSYVTRATTPGQFVVPPAKAEEMYHPETFGRTGTDFVKVE